MTSRKASRWPPPPTSAAMRKLSRGSAFMAPSIHFSKLFMSTSYLLLYHNSPFGTSWCPAAVPPNLLPSTASVALMAPMSIP
ncbi:hypothetical protein HPP92_004439 [Vanilla planifolia]|uniref:Uncharacterized protein n=1 Tax=Vanilla planifolia TaxID=51239 RepID=A0A835VJX6_VANPL|nr:hypothetical protein HPP92_004439 [Vanilla planifolia]